MISGMYLGELTRLVILDAVDKNILFPKSKAKARSLLGDKGTFPTKFISDIEADPTREDFENSKEVMCQIGFHEVCTVMI